MKKIFKYIILFLLIFTSFWILNTYASVDLSWIPGKTNITEHSIAEDNSAHGVVDNISFFWIRLLTIAKYILSWVLVIFLVYAWIQMIMSMWNDEEKLSSSKKQLRYSMIWLIFINIPGTVYQMFVSNKWVIDWQISWTWTKWKYNIFVDNTLFDQTLNWWIVTFIEIVIFAVAIFVITIAWIRIISSRWREEQVTESKNKILWSIVWLIFIWFIESWQNVVYNWKISDWANMFQTMENLALFFAWPVAIFFLTLAWYYYITSNGDEEKVKKAKSIIINTLIAIIIIIASHAFLKDLLELWNT